MTNDIKPNDREEKAVSPTTTASTAKASTVEGASRSSEGSRNWPAGQSDQSSASRPTAEGQQIDGIDDFRIRCLASALYHEDRERFFAWTHRAAMFLVVASGTAALSPLKETYPHAIPAFTTLVGLLDLVFDLSGKARLHAGLRKQIYSVLADANGHDNLNNLERRLTLIYAEEPPCMYAVNAVAYNRAMASYGRPEKYSLDIGWKASFIRHLWPFTPSTFKAHDELTGSPG